MTRHRVEIATCEKVRKFHFLNKLHEGSPASGVPIICLTFRVTPRATILTARAKWQSIGTKQ